MFEVLIGLQSVGVFSKFTDAFRSFYEKVREQVKAGTSLQMLETADFIVYKAHGTERPMGFYDARDFAHKIGLLAGNGEIQQGIEEPTEELIAAAYNEIAVSVMTAQLAEMQGYLDRATSLTRE